MHQRNLPVPAYFHLEINFSAIMNPLPKNTPAPSGVQA